VTAAARAFWSWALILVGGLIATLCGTCTGVYLLGGLVDLFRNGDAGLVGFIAVSALAVGGVPILAGVLLLHWGLRLRRPKASLDGFD
jgi:hypothetical protein